MCYQSATLLFGLGDAYRLYRGLDRRIWKLAWVRSANTMGLSLVLSFMGIYLVTRRGISGTELGVIYLVANGCQAWANTCVGLLSDRIGRRITMTTALVLRAIIMTALGTMVVLEAPVLVIAATMILSASTRGGFEPVAAAVVADVARGPDRVAAFGLQRMGVNVGWATGPALGGLLAGFIDYGYIFYCSVIPLSVSAWAVARMRDVEAGPRAPMALSSSSQAANRAAPDASRRAMVVLLVCAFLFSVVHIQMFSTLAVFAKAELGLIERDIGALFMINGLAVVALQLPAVAVIARLRHELALIAGTMLYVIAFAGIGYADSQLALALCILCATSGEVVVAPAQQATVADLGDPARLGRAFGRFGTMQVLGVAVAPLVGGLAFDHLRHRPALMWGTLAALAGIAAIGYGYFALVQRRRLALATAKSAD